ncbi:MAG: hypothetical protein ACJAYJ_000129 [Saprospiraceae bacterium]|jgi:hypothetical protein
MQCLIIFQKIKNLIEKTSGERFFLLLRSKDGLWLINLWFLAIRNAN